MTVILSAAEDLNDVKRDSLRHAQGMLRPCKATNDNHVSC